MANKRVKLVLCAAVVGLLLLPGALERTHAQAVKEFRLVTGEWQWKAKPGEAPVVDRTSGSVAVMTRYTYDPGFLVVQKGDTVLLSIHDLKGDHHIVDLPAFGINEVKIVRGEERTFRFTADKAGLFVIDCKNHVDAKKEGPMAAYLLVLDR